MRLKNSILLLSIVTLAYSCSNSYTTYVIIYGDAPIVNDQVPVTVNGRTIGYLAKTTLLDSGRVLLDLMIEHSVEIPLYTTVNYTKDTTGNFHISIPTFKDSANPIYAGPTDTLKGFYATIPLAYDKGQKELFNENFKNQKASDSTFKKYKINPSKPIRLHRR